jgi:DNA polymerase
MMPEPAPTVAQLLAFYLEAGVDCALSEESADRLAEPESVPAPREIGRASCRERVSVRV